MSEGPYRVERNECDTLSEIWCGERFVFRYESGDEALVECAELNSAFAAGAESNAKYKAAWEELRATTNPITGLHYVILDEMMETIARKHGLEGE